MAKKSSTGALTPEQHAAQDARYAQGHTYDYVIVGTGHSALVAGSLLANAGYKICMLEYHDVPGGYAHTFRAGDYKFCAQIHYTWSCGKGAKMWQFLEKLGLENELTWELLDTNGYDHMVMPDGKRVHIPYGWDNLADNIEAAYPGQRENVLKFTRILTKIRQEISQFPSGKHITMWDYVTKAHKFRNLIKYRNKTLGDLFDECNLSKEARAVLIANCGDMGEPPSRLSIFSYAGLFGGYNTGAYYPTKHFGGYVHGLTNFIESKDGCHIYYETEVTKVNIGDNGKVSSVETHNGKTLTAEKGFICNLDPQSAAKELIGWDKFPEKFQKQLDYEYSMTGIMIYLGLDDKIDLRDHGFGSYNIWHTEGWSMDEMWDKHQQNDWSTPWWFMSTPTLHTDDPTNSPPGCQILQITTNVGSKFFEDAQAESYQEYMKLKLEFSNKLLEMVEEKYVPNLRKHIVVKQVGTPTTNKDYCHAPHGNAYGSTMTPEQMGPGRLKAWSPWENFWWCNASSGFAGIAGTLHTGIQLYEDLTGDRFVSSQPTISDDELVSALPTS